MENYETQRESLRALRYLSSSKKMILAGSRPETAGTDRLSFRDWFVVVGLAASDRQPATMAARQFRLMPVS